MCGNKKKKSFQMIHHHKQHNILKTLHCEICSKEICVYQTYGARKGLPIDFKDINATDLNSLGLTRDETSRQLHVIKNYELFKGVKAFVVLWNEMPRYHILAKIFSLPAVSQISQSYSSSVRKLSLLLSSFANSFCKDTYLSISFTYSV